MTGMHIRLFTVALLGGVMASPTETEAQVQIRVDGHWEWVSGGAEHYHVAASPTHDLRIPAGHYPPPGECRAWYPGLPPGHQPPPGPCQSFRGAFYEGAVVIGSSYRGGGSYREERRWDFDREYEYRDDRWENEEKYWERDDRRREPDRRPRRY